MKKIYFFLSAACVAVSASAVEKEMAVSNIRPENSQTVQIVKSQARDLKGMAVVNPKTAAKTPTRAGENASVYIRPADNVMSFGPSPEGRMYRLVGFASSYGTVDFYNYSTGIGTYEWAYSDINDFEGSGKDAVWNIKTSDTVDLSIKSGVGYFPAPVFYGTPEGGKDSLEAETNLGYVYCGGGADYWVNPQDVTDEEAFGVTFYQNTGLLDVTPQGNASGYTCPPNTYSPNSTGFNGNGVYNTGRSAWETTLESAWFKGKDVTDIKFNNYTIVQPKPVSTYMMTRGWIWMDVAAKQATQLVSNIYPVDENGEIQEMPIATGYAAIPAGGTDTPIFYYVPLNEDGDEIDDVVYIDSAVAITIEGFAGNEAITEVAPVSGFYPFNYYDYAAGNYDLCKDQDLYLNFDVTADGNVYPDCLVFNLGLYGFSEDENMCTSLSYSQFNTDATFAFIHSVNGVTEVKIPTEGGKAEDEIEALFYNVKGLAEMGYYSIAAPEWLTVEVSDFNLETLTTLTVSAEASEAPREGVVSIEGFGATYELKVVQGEGAGVASVSIEKGAQYFDLQGRKVASPSKGLYIKKCGNKAEKVIL